VLLVSASLLVFFDFDMSAKGHSRRYDGVLIASGLTRLTDIVSAGQP
jgi:hypothetical protein